MSKQKHAAAPKRESFGSHFGIVMAAVGSAVGLGNIWRFSYITGINGGGAFLIVYVLCVLLVGLPVLISELSIGRKSRLSPISSFKKMAPGAPWWITGVFATLAPTIIMGYYPIVAGWSLGYVFESLFNWDALTADTGAFFGSFTAGWQSAVFALIALAVTAVIVMKGVAAGIEKCTKILMPALAVILLILVVRSLTLPGAIEGVKFLFVPDFSKLSVKGVLDAMGHSFFSLSLGMGIMITYSSYMPRDADLPSATASIVTIDTGIAILAGLAIFPAVFALGFDPGEGAGLAFITLPAAFARMPAGWLFSALFFLLIFFAALTSTISLLQVPLAFLEDEFHMPKKKAVPLISAVLVLIGVPAVLAFGPLSDFLIFGKNYFDFLDWTANNVILPITALLGTLFVIFRYGVQNSRKEFLTGAKNPDAFIGKIYPVAVKFIAPIAIVLILLNATGLFQKIFS